MNRKAEYDNSRKKKCVHIVQTSVEGGVSTVGETDIVCHELSVNDENGFTGLFEDSMRVKCNATCKLIDGKIHYTYKYTDDSIHLLNNHCGDLGPVSLNDSIKTQKSPKVMDLEFAVYDLEYTIAAAALNFKLKCQPIVDALKKMYPKYNLAA